MEAIIYTDGEVYTEQVRWKSNDFVQFNSESDRWVILNTLRSMFGDTKQGIAVLDEVLEITQYNY